MKATKFLFVMAMAAGLAACTKELVEPGKPVDSIEEVKGAKVIASGFSINPDASDIQTKIAIQDGKATWTPGDVAGVAWFTNGDVAANQSAVLVTDLKATAYANHKLEYNKEGFESRSNVFEGWHVAYRPYVQMKKPGAIEKIEVNPALTRNLNADKETARRLDRYENSPYFSGALFVSADDVNEEGVVSTPMPMQFVVNALTIDLKVDDSFGDQIKALKVESIELSSSKTKPLFLESLSVNPAAFPVDAPTFTAAHFGTDNTFAFYGEKYAQTSVTEIAEENQENYTLGAGAGEGNFLRTRMFLAPVAEVADLKITDLSLKVNLEGGSYFTLKANAKDTDKTNYDNFNKLYKLFTTVDEAGRTLKGLPGGYPTFEFKLKPADYKTTYTVKKGDTPADDVANMKATVALAKEAGATSIALKFDAGVQIAYEKIDIEDLEMIINCSSTSKNGGATFVISDEQTWNPNIVLGSYMNVEVTETGNLTIAENNYKEQFKVANLTNAGTVNVGENVNIAATTSFDNTGVVNVSKGSTITVDTTTGVEGNVVYTVVGDETTEVIDKLIENTNLGTLIVNEVDEWTALDATAKWSNLTVKMNASKITPVNTGITITVKALEITGNENEITCKTLAVNKANPIIIPAGADAKINAAVTGAVVANGTLNVGNVSSTLTVADGVKVEAGSVKGAATIGAGAEVKAAGFAGGVKIADGATVTVTSSISKGMTIGEEATVTVDGIVTGNVTVGKGSTLTVTDSITGDVEVAEDGTLEAKSVKGKLTVGENAEVTINGDLTGNVTVAKGSTLKVAGAITGAVEVAEGAVLVEVKGVNGDLNVGKDAEVTVTGNIAGAVTVAEGASVTVAGNITGDVDVAEGATFEVEGNIVADKINVAAEKFTVNGNIEITSNDAEADVVIGKNTEFAFFGNVTGSKVEVVINGNATLKHTNMPADSKLTVNGNVTIDTEFMDGIRACLGNVDNNGNLTVVGGKYVFVYNLDMEGSETTTVKDGGILYYYGEVTLGGSTSGTIKKAATPDPANGYEVIGDTYYVNAENGLANALASGEKEINVSLEADVVLAAGTAFDANTESIKIDAKGNTITFNKPALAVLPFSGASVEIKNATIKTSGSTIGGVAREHALVFDCPVKMTDVVTTTTILVRGDYDSEFNNVTFTDTYNSYSLWIDPNGQKVNVINCTFNCPRGIKVEDEHKVFEVKNTELTVSGTKFTTQKKAAVLVHSAMEVKIKWEGGNDISGVAEDTVNAVWIDEKVTGYDYATAKKYIANVVVEGASVIIEGNK